MLKPLSYFRAAKKTAKRFENWQHKREKNENFAVAPLSFGVLLLDEHLDGECVRLHLSIQLSRADKFSFINMHARRKVAAFYLVEGARKKVFGASKL
jgi:hypothetical protein